MITNYKNKFIKLIAFGCMAILFSTASVFAQKGKPKSFSIDLLSKYKKAENYTLSQFEAKYEENRVFLKWKVLGSVDSNDQCWVERSSDGENFKLIGSGDNKKIISSKEIRYSFIDFLPNSDVTFYRILCYENGEMRITGNVLKVVNTDAGFSNISIDKYIPHSIYEENEGHITMR